MKVYAYVYCPCIYESAEGVVSLHFTEEWANAAMNAAKLLDYEQWKQGQQWAKDNPEYGIAPETEYKESDYTYHSIKVKEITE